MKRTCPSRFFTNKEGGFCIFTQALFCLDKRVHHTTLNLEINKAWAEEQGPHYANFTKNIWEISHGELPRIGTYGDAKFQAMLTWTKSLSSRSSKGAEGTENNIFVSLKVSTNKEGQFCIVLASILGDTRKAMVDNIVRLVFYEGLRQQLFTRKGLVCPFMKENQRCQCTRDERDNLERLYHLAKDELFGVGDWPEWKPLSCHYSDIWLPSTFRYMSDEALQGS